MRELTINFYFHALGVSIELSSGKDRSLTVVLTGKGDAVRYARKAIVQQLQTQVGEIYSWFHALKFIANK